MPTIIKRGDRFLARVRRKGFSPVSQTFIRKTDAQAWGSARVPCSCGGENGSCFRCDGTGLYLPALVLNVVSFLSAAVVMEYSGILVVNPLDQIAPGNSVGSSTAAVTGTIAVCRISFAGTCPSTALSPWI